MNDILPIFGAFCMEAVMSERVVMTPGPDHPITISPEPDRIVVKVGGVVIADTRRALTLSEASYPKALYIPRADVNMATLTPSPTRTYCPYKGEASYFSVLAGGPRSNDAAWTYEVPHDGMESIKDHVSFYPDRVSSIERSAA